MSPHRASNLLDDQRYASLSPVSSRIWLALVRDNAVRHGPLPEYSHVALNVDAEELPLAKERLTLAGVGRWQEAERDDSFYFLDPDGHKLELHSGDLRDRLTTRCAAQK